MSEKSNQFEKLQAKIEDLQKRQDLLQAELDKVRGELKDAAIPADLETDKPGRELTGDVRVIPVKRAEPAQKVKKSHGPGLRKDLEKFIGENLINKIGIAVTIIGVVIGAKYAVDHRLISPVTRILLGYLISLGLLFFALRLKKKYGNFSAVLLSGSMAVMYFITYAAYSYYSLYPQILTFFIMVAFTVLTVYGALHYNREIIAVIGMVGAFAIPFLLREGSEKAVVFFGYVTIINSGILAISIRKYWKSLYISSFVFTWLIYFNWFAAGYEPARDFSTAFGFLLVFFIIFYLTFLSYKLIKKEKFGFIDILLLLSNSFIFYGAGYSILRGFGPTKDLTGAFTLGNAVIHAIASIIIYRNKLADRNLFYFVSGLVIIFVTIAVPVQLNGNWVTLLWICEASLLFSLGRIRKAPVYENLSYGLLLLSFLSLMDDLSKVLINARNSGSVSEFIPFLNVQFLSTLIYIGAFAILLLVYFNRKYPSPLAGEGETLNLLSYGLSFLFLLIVYLAIRIEITSYFEHLQAIARSGAGTDLHHDDYSGTNIFDFKQIWLCNYSLLFLALLSVINTFKIGDKLTGTVTFWLIIFNLLIFLSHDLYVFSELRERYLAGLPSYSFRITGLFISVRYISYVFVALALLATKLWLMKEPVPDYSKIIFSLFFHLSLLWILCSEMLNIMDLYYNNHSYKFGLSILAGIYALGLIVLGIRRKRRYLRIAAIVLLGVTLAKLFFYDITRLDTILKTILFLVIGTVLLLVSFLYNKYKDRIFG